MFEPRANHSWLQLPIMQFLGGTPEFDLWLKHIELEWPTAVPYLRVVSMKDSPNFDEFQLPLGMSPASTASGWVKGRWSAQWLSKQNILDIETYLRCFAPWVLDINLTDKDKSNVHERRSN